VVSCMVPRSVPVVICAKSWYELHRFRQTKSALQKIRCMHKPHKEIDRRLIVPRVPETLFYGMVERETYSCLSLLLSKDFSHFGTRLVDANLCL